MGLTHFELADFGLTTLEKWNTSASLSDADGFKELLFEVLPSLDDYLRSELNDAKGKPLLLHFARGFFMNFLVSYLNQWKL